MQQVGFNCIENASMLKIKLQTAHFAFQALLFLTGIRVSVASGCRKTCISDKNPSFPEKVLLKENSCLGLLKNAVSETLVQWKSVLH